MTARRILAAGWLLFMLFAFPGYLTTESLDQLMDARVDQFTDWYAPVMSWIWRLIGHLIAGPAGMLALQSLLFLAGAFGLLRRALPDRAAALATCGVLLFPPITTVLAVIWRDGQLAGFILAGAAAVASDRRGWRIAGLALLIIGATMRDGATIAALPIVVALFWWRADVVGWRRAAIAAAAWVAVVAGATGLDRGLADAETERPALTLARLDVLGVVRFAETTSDADLHAELARAGLAGAVPDDVHHQVRILYKYPERHAELLALPAKDDPSGRAALLRARRELAWAHPRAYVWHRGRQLRLALGLEPSERWTPIYTSFTEKPAQRLIVHQRATHSAAQQLLIDAVEETPAVLFRPYLYAALALLLLPLAIIRRQRDALALLASGLAYEASLFVTVVTPEYRHSHWLITCTVIGAVMLAARELSSRAARRARPAAAPVG